MKIKISELTKIIENKISNYQVKTSFEKGGQVVSIGDGIAIVQGLKEVGYLEKVLFENHQTGIALTLEEDYVGVIILDKANTVKEYDRVVRTGETFAIPVGANFLGRIIDPIGNPLDGKGPILAKQTAVIEKVAPQIMERQSVDTPLETGILAIDALFPIGKGQRELIIGDRQTGKTTILTDTIVNQKGKNVICIYVGIGQKSSALLEIYDKFTKFQALEHTIIVSATAAQSESLKYIAPFAGMTIAEWFLAQGKDVLIVFDDLTKHAIAYRGLSLLLNKTPGREAYPGDVFYLHSRLLERAVRLNKEHGNGSITALPVIETQQQDLVAYIPTNVISITDGQIFLLTDLFNLGFKPAVDYGLSVSRVGSAAQIPQMKKMVGSLKLDLAQYKEFEVFNQFGGNIDAATQKILDHGQRVLELLKQPEGQSWSHKMMVVLLFAIQERLIRVLPLNAMTTFKKTLQNHFAKLQTTEWQKFQQSVDWDPQQAPWLRSEIKQVIAIVQRQFAQLKRSVDETNQKKSRAKN